MCLYWQTSPWLLPGLSPIYSYLDSYCLRESQPDQWFKLILKMGYKEPTLVIKFVTGKFVKFVRQIDQQSAHLWTDLIISCLFYLGNCLNCCFWPLALTKSCCDFHRKFGGPILFSCSCLSLRSTTDTTLISVIANGVLSGRRKNTIRHLNGKFPSSLRVQWFYKTSSFSELFL